MARYWVVADGLIRSDARPGARTVVVLIVFSKLAGNKHSISVKERRRGPDVVLPSRETGPTIPHDLAHAAVEEALGLAEGFWGAIDGGATFPGFEPSAPGRHRRSGLKALRRKEDATVPAEMAVSWAHRVWSGQRVEGRGLGAPPLDAAQIARSLRGARRGARAVGRGGRRRCSGLALVAAPAAVSRARLFDF